MHTSKLVRKKRIAYDLDGTLVEEMSYSERPLAKPIQSMINRCNQDYDSGYFIMIFTARGWHEYDMTKAQLNRLGIKHHILLCGKPIYDEIVDDRARFFLSGEIWEPEDLAGKNVMLEHNVDLPEMEEVEHTLELPTVVCGFVYDPLFTSFNYLEE